MASKAILFDLDGTLLETHWHSCRAAHETLRALHLPDVSDEIVMRHIGEPAEVFLRAIAPGYSDPAGFEALFDANERAALKTVGKLYDGVPELIAALQKRGYRLAICSNGNKEYVEAALETTGIRAAFARLACAGEFPEKASAVSHLLREWNCDLAVMIGDRVHDREAAEKNSLPFIAAVYGYGGEELIGSVYRARNPLEILQLLEQIEKDVL
jgi:phosphoglycolate phosphatase